MFGQITTKTVLGSHPHLGVLAPSPFAGVDPFAPVFASCASSAAAKPSFEYALWKSGPAVAPAEVESASEATVEVKVLWGATVLARFAHVDPSRGFTLGDGSGKPGKKAACDFLVASEALGAKRAPLVLGGREGAVLVVLARATGTLETRDCAVSFASLVASGRARPSSAVAGAHEIDLPVGAEARVQIEGCPVTFQASAVMAGKRLSADLAVVEEPASIAYSGLSLLMHLGLVSVCAFFMPRTGATDADDVDRDRISMMARMLDATAEREHDRRLELSQDAATAASEGAPGAAATGAPGAMGTTATVERHNRYAIPRTDADQGLVKAQAMLDARRFGDFIGQLSSASANVPVATWGHEAASGADATGAMGNMFDRTIGDSAGSGGLTMSGPGEGGGGTSHGIGMGDIGGLGHGGGVGPNGGIGHGGGTVPGTYHPKAPSVREGAAAVNGHLPAEVIQRIVRQNFGRFRACYEEGLRGNPGLQGRVSTKFVIDRSGAVSLTADGGSDLPDRQVVQCVVRAFGGLSFPPPDGGMVRL